MTDVETVAPGCKRARALRVVRLVMVLAAFLLGACRNHDRQELRVGFLTNLTNAVPMVMEERRSLASEVDGPVELVPFHAGPSAIEALLAGDLDVAYCGPSPAINAYVRSEGQVRILAGAAYGGAALVVRKDLDVTEPRDLRKARIASPQLGNTQDVALREWLADNDLVDTDRGGTVRVVPMSSPDILSLFRAKELDAAWVVEPWVTRLINEGNARVFVDESTLHPNGEYPTTVVVVTSRLLRERPQQVAAIAKINAATVAWIKRNPAAARTLVNAALERHTGKALPPQVIGPAWERLRFGTDPLLPSLRTAARTARRIGYLPYSDIDGIVIRPDEYAVRVKAVSPRAKP